MIACTEAETLPGLFSCRVRKTPRSPAYRQFDTASGQWRHYTWEETAALVARWQRALARENLEPGERVAILLRNSVEWVCFEQAALALGLVIVPLYPSDSADSIAYILEDSAASLLLTGTRQRWETLSRRCDHLTGLRKVLCVENPAAAGTLAGEGETACGRITLESVDDWLLAHPSAKDRAENAENGKTGEAPDAAGRQKYHHGDPGALATLVYTSGTTGRPKGVMLSHHNILWDAQATLSAIPGYPDDVYLSLLPLSHMLERTVGYYVPMMAGSSVAYARSLKDLPQDMASAHPTIFVGVPQVYAGIRARICQQVQEKGRLAMLLFDWTVDIGWARFTAEQRSGQDGKNEDGHEGEENEGNRASNRDRPVHGWHRLAWPFLHRLVAAPVLARFGGRLRLAVSGGGPLHPEISRCFIGLGLPLIQGYGLTEASPVLTANRMEDNIPASVGPPLPGIELRVGDSEELLARGPGVMLGYWNRPDDTRGAVDAEGWLHTGDQAHLSDDHVFITGRIKEIIVTAAGEKIAPVDLETAIIQEPLFEQVMVVGEGRPHLAALLVLDRGEWKRLAASIGLNADDDASLVQPSARAAALKKIRAALRDFPKHARIRAVHSTLEPWNVENGLLTPTLKLKRAEIEKRFSEEIAGMYET